MIKRNEKYRGMENKNYNQLLTYAIITGALSLGLTLPVQAKPLSNPPISIENTKIDRHFIDKMEGTDLKANVPLPKTSQSGVTIGSGFDLGSLSIREYNRLPLSSALKAKLAPYVSLKRFRAVAFLKAHPLTIKVSDLQEVNKVSENQVLQPLVKNFNKASKIPFTQLPPQAQTALFSFAYQYGAGFRENPHTRRLWDYYTTENWSKAEKTLRSFKMYSSRRHAEANLLKNL